MAFARALPNTVPMRILLPVLLLATVAAAQSRNAGTFHSDKGVRALLRDHHGDFWFATDGDGVCRFDGTAYTWLTTREGLASDFARTIQQDAAGALWFETRDGISRWDGRSFTTFAGGDASRVVPYRLGAAGRPADGLWFAGRDGAYHHDGTALAFLALPLAKADLDLRATQPGLNQTAYDLYTILSDRDGDVWFCTESRGAFRFDGRAFHRVSSPDFDQPLRAAYQDRRGTLWFGNNGEGLFRYDGGTLTDVTRERGLGNPAFRKTLEGKPGTLARVWTINEDAKGDLWIGTFDAGLWRYDGRTLKNYTSADGLPSDCITTSYRDPSGTLWFGTGNGGVFRFDGKRFVRFGRP